MNRLPSSAQDLPDSPPMNMKSPSAMVGVGAGGDAGDGGGAGAELMAIFSAAFSSADLDSSVESQSMWNVSPLPTVGLSHLMVELPRASLQKAPPASLDLRR